MSPNHKLIEVVQSNTARLSEHAESVIVLASPPGRPEDMVSTYVGDPVILRSMLQKALKSLDAACKGGLHG